MFSLRRVCDIYGQKSFLYYTLFRYLKKEGSVKKGFYLENWHKLSLPVVQIANELNPFYNKGVVFYAALANHLPYENIKFITVYGLLQNALDVGALQKTKILVEATSGNTGVALALMAKHFGINKVKLVVAPDIPDGKRYPLILAGAELIYPKEGLSAIATAREMGGGGWKPDGWQPDSGYLNLDQYANPFGAEPHSTFTADKIVEKLFYNTPSIFVSGIGTGGTMVGIGKYIKRNNMRAVNIGVLLKAGSEIPGVRDLNRMKEITLPWRDFSDGIVEIGSRQSYLASLWLNWVMGITPGPSSGFAYLGALKFIKSLIDSKLDSFRDDHDKVRVVVIFPDGNRPYGDRYMANLPFECLSPATAPLPWNWKV